MQYDTLGTPHKRRKKAICLLMNKNILRRKISKEIGIDSPKFSRSLICGWNLKIFKDLFVDCWMEFSLVFAAWLDTAQLQFAHFIKQVVSPIHFQFMTDFDCRSGGYRYSWVLLWVAGSWGNEYFISL